MRLVYVATEPVTAYRLLDGQLGYMQRQGFDVTVVTSPGELLLRTAQREGVQARAVPMTRDVSPGQDVRALYRLTALLRELKPTIVNAGTPKAGLLGVAAARLAGVPVVVYLLRGLRFEGARGAKRLLLAGTEHLAAGLAHRVFANSESLRQRFTSLGCASPERVWVPCSGSSNGVDVQRFLPNEARRAWALDERRRRALSPEDIVVGFVGRFTSDKGIVALVQAFRIASEQEPRLRLLLVGDHDDSDPLPSGVAEFLRSDSRVSTTGFVDEPAPYYGLMDLFVFPSLREGFPNAPLEAAASEVPVIAFRATGTVDAVVDGQTGALLAAGDVDLLSREILRYAADPELRARQGRAGRRRVEASFDRELVWQALEGEYRRLVALAGVKSEAFRAFGSGSR